MTVLTGRLADGSAVQVTIQGERIASVRPVRALRSPASDAAPSPGRLPWILPGLVDLQVNGYAGFDVNADDLTVDDVHALVRALWKRGVTTFLPTLITAAQDKLVDALRVLARARAGDPLTRHTVAGTHLEGPYLSADDGPRGAHDAAHIRSPSLQEFTQWREASAGALRIITLAPEAPGALDYIRAVTAHDTLIAIGHTAAAADEIHAAADAGARLSTHLGNGCHPVLPRHPNHLWAQLAEQRLSATFIGDGHHLPADTFNAMVRAKGLRDAILVSDSVTLAGCAPGEYHTPVGGAVTMHADGRLTLAGSELLAGSGVSQADCLAWAATRAGLGLPAAAALASTNPARVLGLGERGHLRAGATADIVLLGPDLDAVHLTMVRGDVVYSAEGVGQETYV